MTRTGEPVIALCLLTALAGCASSARESELDRIAALYHRGDYTAAYRQAAALAEKSTPPTSEQAAYLAGLSAYRLGDRALPLSWLSRAARSRDDQLSGDALATLGIFHSEQGRHDAAAQALEQAAGKLTGQDRAQAFFYAGVAQQKLGQWALARANLERARNATSDAGFRGRVNQQMLVTAFTLQVGAFGDVGNAQRAARDLTPRAAALGLPAPRLVRAEPFTQVHLGSFPSHAHALAVKDRLSLRDAVIVPLIGR